MKTRLKNELIASIAKDEKKDILAFLEVNIIETPKGIATIEIILVALNMNDFDRIYSQRIEPTLHRYGVIHNIESIDSPYELIGSYITKRAYYITAENHSNYIMRMDEANGTVSEWKIPFLST